MKNVEKLNNLISNEIMPDLEEAIDEMFAIVERDKTISLSDREELEMMQDMHAECREILIEIEAEEMDEEEATEILSELFEAKSE